MALLAANKHSKQACIWTYNKMVSQLKCLLKNGVESKRFFHESLPLKRFLWASYSVLAVALTTCCIRS